MANSHRSHPIMKQMTWHVNFGILVWWGKFVDIWIVGFRFLDDVMMFEQRRFMSGAGIPFSINSVKVDQI